MKPGDVVFWGPEPVGVKHHDPAVRRVIEELVTDHLEEYQQHLLDAMREWTLNGAVTIGPEGVIYRDDTLRPDFLSSVALNPWTRYDAVVRVADKHRDLFSRYAFGVGMIVHPRDWEEIYGPMQAKAWQPWLWLCPPLVVDKEALGRQIAWCLDPNKAAAEWFESEIGRQTGLFYPGLGTTRQLQDWVRKNGAFFPDLSKP